MYYFAAKFILMQPSDAVFFLMLEDKVSNLHTGESTGVYF
jgi:hypothetical protein